MKTLRLIAYLLLATLNSAYAQERGIPNSLLYQGSLLESNNRPKPNGQYQFTFSLYDEGGAQLWKGDYNLHVVNGSFTCMLGPFPVSIDFAEEYELEIEVEGKPLTSRVSLNSAAYAFGIADGSVTDKKIKDRQVTTRAIAENAVTSTKLRDEAVTTAKVNDLAITEQKLQDGAITNSKLTDFAVSESKIDNGAISTDKLQASSVTYEKIALDAVSSGEIIDGSIESIDIADNSIGSAQLQNSVSFDRVVWQNGGPVIVNIGTAFNGNDGSYWGGGVFVYGPEGSNAEGTNSAAGFFGNGLKPFIVRDPTDGSRLIQYVALEGPEAGIYYRGKARLQGGSVTIELPNYFSSLAVDSTLTFCLTPHSAISRGLAVVSSDSRRLMVQELAEGTGTYEFSFSVFAVRKGFENYNPYITGKDGQFPNFLQPFNKRTPSNDR